MIYELPKFKDWVDQPVRYFSPKADGHLQYVHVDGQRRITVLTKNLKDNTEKLLSVEHIKQELQGLPPNSFVIGECYAPTELATEVPHMLCTGDSRLQFSVFAAPFINDTNLVDVDLKFVMSIVKNYGLNVIPIEPVMPATQGLNCTFRAQLLREAVSQKIEGWVLKERHMSGWYKLKPVKTVDAFVLDVTESDSKTYAGHMKALILGLYKPDGTVHDLGECGGGFTKAFKLSMPYNEMKEHLLGRVAAFEFDSITKHQKLRFPRIAKDKQGQPIWRTDKDAVQCLTEQLT